MDLKKKRENYKKFEPLHQYAHDISIKLLDKITQRDRDCFHDGEKGSDLYRLTEDSMGYVVYIERRALEISAENTSVVWNDDYTNRSFMVSRELTEPDMVGYVMLGQRKLPSFFKGPTGSATSLNHLTGFYTHFLRYDNVISENFMPQQLWPLADEFARANNRLIQIHPEDLLKTKFEEVRNVTSITKAKAPRQSK